MSYVNFFAAFTFAFIFFLFPPQHRQNDNQGSAPRRDEDAVRSAMQYCGALDDTLEHENPKIFGFSTTEHSGQKEWREFSNRDEWEAAGKPVPLAFVWDQHGVLVRVTVVARISVAMRRRVEYCFGTDAKLIRIRAVPFAPQSCEFLFPCRLINDSILNGEHTAVTDWLFIADGTIKKLRNGKSVDDYFDPSNSLTVSNLHLPTSDDLPFKYQHPN
jgi:hypothetical protein